MRSDSTLAQKNVALVRVALTSGDTIRDSAAAPRIPCREQWRGRHGTTSWAMGARTSPRPRWRALRIGMASPEFPEFLHPDRSPL